MRNAVKRIVTKLFPELANGTHLPMFAVVIEIPDPPTGGEPHTHERPRYAINCRMLTAELSVDHDMPLLRDVPVAIAGAGDERGFAALPQPGVIVEIAFAYGRQSLPFVRSVMPYNLDLPGIDGNSQRWQASDDVYQETNDSGDWKRKGQNIRDNAAMLYQLTAKKIWIGSDLENFLVMVSSFMGTVSAALADLAGHTHATAGLYTLQPTNSADISAKGAACSAVMGHVDTIAQIIPPTAGDITQQ